MSKPAWPRPFLPQGQSGIPSAAPAMLAPSLVWQRVAPVLRVSLAASHPPFLSPCQPIGIPIPSLIPLWALQPIHIILGLETAPGVLAVPSLKFGVTWRCFAFGDNIVTLLTLMSHQVMSGVVQMWCGALRGHQGHLHGGRRAHGHMRGRGGQGVFWDWSLPRHPSQGCQHPLVRAGIVKGKC